MVIFCPECKQHAEHIAKDGYLECAGCKAKVRSLKELEQKLMTMISAEDIEEKEEEAKSA